MKAHHRTVIAVAIAAVIIGVIFLTVPALDEVVHAAGAFAVVGGLLSALFTLTRDAATRDHAFELQARTQADQQLLADRKELMDIGITSHMATKLFDEQCEFAKTYIGVAKQAVIPLLKDPSSGVVHKLYSDLVDVRRDFATWVTPEITNRLSAFENKLWLAYTCFYIADQPEWAEKSVETKNEGMMHLRTFVGLKFGGSPDEHDQQLAIDSVVAFLQEQTGIAPVAILKNHRLSEAIARHPNRP